MFFLMCVNPVPYSRGSPCPGVSFWHCKGISKWYPFCTKEALQILIQFAALYMCKPGFSTIVVTKKNIAQT